MKLFFGLLLLIYVFVAFALLIAFLMGARDNKITAKFVFIGIALTLLWPVVVPVVIAAVIVQAARDKMDDDYME